MPRRRSASSLLGVSLGMLAALALHGLSLVTLSALGVLAPSVPVVQDDIDLVSLPATEWEQSSVVDSTTPPPSKSKKDDSSAPQKHVKEKTPSGQVVDVAAGNDQKPDETKYLAEHDNKVDKQTRAREQTPFYGKAMPQQTNNKPPEPKAKKEQTRLAGNQGTGDDDGKKARKTQIEKHEIPDAVEQKKEAILEHSADGEIRTPEDANKTAGNSKRLLLSPGALAAAENNPGAEGKAGTPDTPALPPSAAPMDKTVGAAPNDFLQGLTPGDGTFLNTREFKYASFFNRVKQRVGEVWSPNDVMRRKDPRGRRSGYQDRVTVVEVTLDEDGHLAAIHIGESCGVDFLDEEAVAAFERAAPFLNPPEGLLDEDRHLRFRFGFHIDNEHGQIPALRGLPGTR